MRKNNSKAANDIEKYLQTIQGASNLKSQEKDKKISDYKQEIKNKKSERDVLQNKIISIKGELAEKLNKIDEDEKETIKKIELEEKLEVEKINKENFIVGNKITLARKFHESKKNEERSKAQSKREREEARLNTVIKSNTQNLQKINIDINNLEKRILDLQSVNVEIKSADQSKIDQINKDRDNKVKNIDKLINQLNSSITQKINSTLGRNNSEINEIKKKNKIIDKKINDELNFKIKEEQRISKEYGEKIDENNNRLAEEINRLSDNRKNKIPQIESQIIQLNEKLAKAKEEKRIKSQANQVYRLAAWWYNQKDIADVTKKQLDFIAFIWFGSIAFVAATIGTV